MPADFLQWLIILLVAMLFGKDTLLPFILEKMGIKTREKAPGEENASLRNDFQSLLMEMQTLSAYFNHDTTEQLKVIQEASIGSNQILREIKEYGIKCRKE